MYHLKCAIFMGFDKVRPPVRSRFLLRHRCLPRPERSSLDSSQLFLPSHCSDEKKIFFFFYHGLFWPVLKLRINEFLWFVLFGVQLPLLSVFLRLTQVVVSISSWSPFYWWVGFCCRTVSEFVYPLINGHLVCFQFWFIMYKTAANILYESFWRMFFYISRVNA